MLTRRILHGTIVSRTAGKLDIIPSEHCETATSCDRGCTSCGGKRPAQKLVVTAPDAENYAVGSSVTVTTLTLNEAFGALIVFGIPLFFATGAIVIRYIISPSKIDSPASFMVAASAFAAGFVVVAIIDTFFRRRYPPHIVSDTATPLRFPAGDKHHHG